MDKLSELKDVTGTLGPQAEGYAPVYNSIVGKFTLQRVVTSVAKLFTKAEAAAQSLLYVLVDGTRPLTGEWDIGEDMAIKAERFEARDAEGLRLEDDGGNLGLFVADGGAVLAGTATALTGAFAAGQVQIDKATNGTLLLTRTSADTGAPTLEFFKRRSGMDVVSSGDRLGSIGFSGADSVDAAMAAQIYAEVDGSPGSNDMPGRIVFATTADAASSVTEAMRINASQNLIIADGKRIETDQVRARDSGGLALYDDAGTAGIFIEDGGEVGIGTSSPDVTLHVVGTGIRAQRTGGNAFIQLGAPGSTTDGGSIYGVVGGVGMTFHSGFGGTERMRLESNGRLGIAKTDPQLLLHVNGGIALERDTNNAVQWYAGNNARNKLYSDTSNIMYFNSFGDWIWETNTPTERMRLTNAGRLGIADSTPDGMLDVVQGSTTAAIPVVELNQTDLSEEFINFISTIGTGNPIEAVGAKTLTTTHFIRIQVDTVGYRYFAVGTIA